MTSSIDKPMLYAVIALATAGFLILASASIVASQNDFGNSYFYVLRQLLYGGAAGAVLLLAAYNIPYRLWGRLALPLIFVSFILLALLFIPELGYESGGARRWLVLGTLSMQPSEFLKIAFVVYLARWLASRRNEIASVSYGMAPFALMLSVIGVFLLMQPDVGTLGVIVLTAIGMYFLGGGKIAQIVTLAMLGLGILALLVQLAPYRLDRITVFLNPETDPTGIGYQINQALIAIGSGGFFGAGFGQSIQKYNYLPEPMGDSVFAIFAEEMGLAGSVALIALFCFFLWRGLIVARRAPDLFGQYLAGGITIGIGAQAFVNMAAISGLIPLTGIPLPFISYGGTSLAITLASMGILLNISRYR